MLEIYWQVDSDRQEKIQWVCVRYNRSATLASEGEFWLYSDTVPYMQGRLELYDLSAASNYQYQLGYSSKSELGSKGSFIWLPRKQFETRLPWGFTRFLLMIGALGLFIFGMKTMSEGVQASAGGRLRKALGGMTRNRFTGVLSGFGLTALLQSSSATTVMTVSFVNAGLISLSQSAGIMMGANIGTTITGWLVSFFGLRVNITLYALALFALAFPLLFFSKREIRTWATPIIGLALLFMGLGFLRSTVPSFTEDSALVRFLVAYSEIPFLGNLLFVLLGIVITVVVQSSSSAITLTMTLCASGVIPLETAAAMVLGENIGTTATAEIAALVGNVHAKRSARIHTLFNVIGVGWMLLILPYVLRGIGNFLPVDPTTDSPAGLQSATAALAILHTVFNVLNLALLIWFVPYLVKLATWTVPSRNAEDEIHRLAYIDTSIQLSELNIVEAKRAVNKFARVVLKMQQLCRAMLSETDDGKRLQMIDRVRRYEDITDRMELELSQYCSRISTSELSPEVSERVRSMLSISNELENLGDEFRHISITVKRKNEAKIWFTQEQRDKLNELFDLLEHAMQVMMENLDKPEGTQISLEPALKAEQALNKAKKQISKEYVSRIEKGKYNLRSGTIYSDLFSSIEKAGNHVMAVSEALSGNV